MKNYDWYRCTQQQKNNFNRLTIIFDRSCLCFCSLRSCFLCLSLQLCACFRKKVRKKTSKTFILKLLFAFVQTVAFQTSLRSYGSRRSWCFFFYCFLSTRKEEDFSVFQSQILERNFGFFVLKWVEIDEVKKCFKRYAEKC